MIILDINGRPMHIRLFEVIVLFDAIRLIVAAPIPETFIPGRVGGDGDLFDNG